MATPCPFCNPEDSDIVLKNGDAYARWDKYPVNPGHILIIPFEHVPDYWSVDDWKLIEDLWQTVEKAKEHIDSTFKVKPDGYNIGINCGEFAGQTIFHLHIHLIPRYKGDSEKPRGGVRGVIPDKKDY